MIKFENSYGECLVPKNCEIEALCSSRLYGRDLTQIMFLGGGEVTVDGTPEETRATLCANGVDL